MIPIIDRYLLLEIFKALLAILIILLLIFMGSMFIRLLKEISLGELNASLLFNMLGLEMFLRLARLVPPAFFFALLYAIGRMYRDSEITAMEACGVGGSRLFRAILIATLPAILLVGWLSMAVAPWSAKSINNLLNEQRGQATELAGVSPGRFNEYSQGELIFYVESISDKERHMQNLFVQHRKDGEISLISAARGYQKSDEKSGERFLVLEDGYRYQGLAGAANYRISEFGMYALRIEDVAPARAKRPWRGRSNRDLLTSENIRDRTEFQVRLSTVLALLVVALLALPLSRTGPRQGPYGRLVLAIVIYTVYLSLQGVSEKWMVNGVTPAWLGMWWIHLSMAFIALMLFIPETVWYRGMRRRLRSRTPSR
jgi:lipopolysaccharide export system permease protein